MHTALVQEPLTQRALKFDCRFDENWRNFALGLSQSNLSRLDLNFKGVKKLKHINSLKLYDTLSNNSSTVVAIRYD